MPSARRRAQQLGQRLLLQAAQARGRLVQHDQQRTRRKRARDFQYALLPEREIAGELVRLVGKTDTRQFAHRLVIDRALLRADRSSARRR